MTLSGTALASLLGTEFARAVPAQVSAVIAPKAHPDAVPANAEIAEGACPRSAGLESTAPRSRYAKML